MMNLGDPKDQPESGSEAVAIGQLGLDVELDGVARNLRKARLSHRTPLSSGCCHSDAGPWCHTGLPEAGNGPAVNPRPSRPGVSADPNSACPHGR